MKRDQTFKLRLSETDINKLDYCKQTTGRSRSEVIRQGIDEITEKIKKDERNKREIMNRLYVEEVTRASVGYSEKFIMNRDELIESLINGGNGTEQERIFTASIMVESIDAGKEITQGQKYISKYRIATEEEIAEHKRQDEEEIDKIPLSPESEAFFEKMRELQKQDNKSSITHAQLS